MLTGRRGRYSLPPPRRRLQLHVVWEDWGAGQNILELSEDDVTVLQDVKLKPARDPHNLTQEQAIKLVLDSCKKFKSPALAMKRTTSSDRFAFALFNDMDSAFFGGILRGNVVLKFNENLPPGYSGFTTRAGQIPRTVIELASHTLRVRPVRGLCQALLHQMVHAYLLQCCSTEKPVENPSISPLKHGDTFSTICYILQRAFPGLIDETEPPASIGCFQDGSGGFYGLAPFHPANEFELSRLYGIGRSSTQCVPENLRVSHSRCEILYRHIINHVELPKLDLEAKCPKDSSRTPRPITQYVHNFNNGKYTPILRSKYASVISFVEVHFKDRAVPIPQVNPIPSIGAKKSGSAIKLSTTNDDEFAILYEFLTTARYGATLTVMSAGPPVIIVQSGSLEIETAPALVDVRAYRVATEAEIPEMQTFALGRLYAYPVMREDAVAVLEYIYHGPPPSKGDEGKKKKAEPKPPDSNIRKWVREWLLVRNELYRTNLGALRRNPLLMEKFSSLRAKGGLLITDVDYVDREIDSAIERTTREAMTRQYVAQPARQLAVQQPLVQPRLEIAPVPPNANWMPGSQAVFPINGPTSWL